MRVAQFVSSLWRTTKRSIAAARHIRPSAFVNGAAAAVGIALVALAGAFFAGEHAPILMVGAICGSVPDTPSPLPDKLKRIALALGLGAFSVLLARLTAGHMYSQPVAILVTGFIAAMTTAFGRSAIPVGVSILLALILAGLSGQSDDPWSEVAWFILGGAGYALYTCVITPLLALQTKQLLVQEALQSLAAYVRAQKQALDPGAQKHRVYARLIDAQAVLAERIQAARNVVFVDTAGSPHRQVAAELLVAIDCLEASLSTQADLDSLLEAQSALAEPIQALRGLLLLAASELEHLATSVRKRAWIDMEPIGDRAALLAQARSIPRDAPGDVGAVIHATADKLLFLLKHLDRLRAAQANPALSESVIGSIDLTPFVQRFLLDWGAVSRELHVRSPVFRYALRLSLAMFCGSLVEALLPYRAHGSWILLTVALVMRASYSVTRQRRRERLLGNLIGCLVSPALLLISPPAVVQGVIFVAAGTAHAFAAQSYMVASIASCVMALMQIHISSPGAEVFFVLRLVDTAIGGSIAFAFSFLLPHWEHQTIARAVRDLLRAQEDCARYALNMEKSDQAYRLARRRVFDTLASLSSAVSRMLEEPSSAGYDTRSLSEFLAVSYVFAAELASVQVFVSSRGDRSDARLARAMEVTAKLVQRRFAGVESTSGGASPRPALPDVHSLEQESYENAGILARRLRRVVQVAERVKRLGDKTLLAEKASA